MLRVISVFIGVCLCLQMSAVLLRSGPWAYPFVNYPMYSAAHYEGERILVEHTIFAVFIDGSERPITRADVGEHYWFYENWARMMVEYPGDTYVLGTMKAVETRKATGIRRWLKQQLSREHAATHYINVFTRLIEAMAGKIVSSYRIEDFPAILTQQGYKDAEGGSEVLKLLKIEHGEPKSAGG
jgi:hypothetical protein